MRESVIIGFMPGIQYRVVAVSFDGQERVLSKGSPIYQTDIIFTEASELIIAPNLKSGIPRAELLEIIQEKVDIATGALSMTSGSSGSTGSLVQRHVVDRLVSEGSVSDGVDAILLNDVGLDS